MNLILLLLGLAGAAFGGSVTVSPAELSFGKVTPGVTVEREFELRNNGSAPLRISAVRLTPPLRLAKTPATIAPGAVAVLRVQLPTAGLQQLYEGELRVQFSDPATPEAGIDISASIIPPIEILPSSAVILTTVRGKGVERSIEIVNHQGTPLKILSSTHGEIEEIEAGQRYRLTLRMSGDEPAGRRSTYAEIRTSSLSTPVVRFLLATSLRERVYTFPDTVDFGNLPVSVIRQASPDAPGLSQTLMIYRLGTTGFDVQVSSDLPGIAVRAERGPQGDRYQLTLTFDRARIQPGPISGTLTLNTNDEQFPSVRVPITGHVSD